MSVFKSVFQNPWILVLMLSSFWGASLFGPLLYSVVSPTEDLRAIVLAMQGHGVPPPEAAGMVRDAIDQGGQLWRSIHVAHYSGASIILRNNESHTMTKIEDSYLAWFQRVPKPVLLIVRRYKVDGSVRSYEVGSDRAAGENQVASDLGRDFHKPIRRFRNLKLPPIFTTILWSSFLSATSTFGLRLSPRATRLT